LVAGVQALRPQIAKGSCQSLQRRCELSKEVLTSGCRQLVQIDLFPAHSTPKSDQSGFPRLKPIRNSRCSFGVTRPLSARRRDRPHANPAGLKAYVDWMKRQTAIYLRLVCRTVCVNGGSAWNKHHFRICNRYPSSSRTPATVPRWFGIFLVEDIECRQADVGNDVLGDHSSSTKRWKDVPRGTRIR
jgi:hypothetical protein